MATNKPYPKYKNSNIPWLAHIPEKWQIKRAKWVFREVDFRSESGNEELLSVSEHYGVIKRKNANVNMFKAASYIGYKVCNPGDLVINSLWAWSRGLGFSKYHGIVSTAYGVYRPNPNEVGDYQYFHYLLRTKMYVGQYAIRSKGIWISRLQLSDKNFLDIPILIPPKEEQTAIARFLDYKLAKINRFIKKKRQILALYAERRKSLTRELVHSKGVKYIRLSAVAKLIERPIERLDDEVYTPVGLYNRGRGLFQKEPTLGKELGDSNFFSLKKGDVILSGQFAWEGSVALVGVEDEGCIASHRYPVLDCDLNQILPEYLFSFFTVSEGHLLLDYHSRGAAGRNRPLNPRRLVKEKIPVPGIDLQKELIDLIEKEKEFKTLVNKEIALVEEYKTALIAEAVTGKIDVRGYEIPERDNEEESYEELEEEMSMAAEDAVEYQTVEEEQ